MAETHRIQKVRRGNSYYPAVLSIRLEGNAPESLFAIGNLEILKNHKLALFCSSKCPGEKILKAFDYARSLRDKGQTVISGFHSPIEKDCLRILLRGEQPIIICPARSLDTMRLPKEWKDSVFAGRLLILSSVSGNQRRPTTDLARERNFLVAALADEIYFIHVEPDGLIDDLTQSIKLITIPSIFLK